MEVHGQIVPKGMSFVYPFKPLCNKTSSINVFEGSGMRQGLDDLVKSLLVKGGKTDFQVRQCGIRRTRKSVVPLNQQALKGFELLMPFPGQTKCLTHSITNKNTRPESEAVRYTKSLLYWNHVASPYYSATRSHFPSLIEEPCP